LNYVESHAWVIESHVPKNDKLTQK